MAENYQRLRASIPEQNQERIKTTLDWFINHPWLAVFWYQFVYFFKEFALLGRFFRWLFPNDHCDGELYAVLRIIDRLGGNKYIRTLSTNFDKNNGSDLRNVYESIKIIFDRLYAKDNKNIGTSIVEQLSESQHHKDTKKRALLLRLMPQFKARFNRFARKYGLEEIAFSENGDLDKKSAKAQLKDGELPTYSWQRTLEKEDSKGTKGKKRKTKKWLNPLAKFFAFLVTAGQAIIGAYAIHAFVVGINGLAPWAPLLTAIAFFTGFLTNYILFRGRTINTFKQFVINRDPTCGLKGPKPLIILSVIVVLLSSLAAGFIMGAISWIGVVKLMPGFPMLALISGITLMIANLFAYTSLMLVSGMNLIQKMIDTCRKMGDWWQDYKTRFRKAPGKTLFNSGAYLLITTAFIGLAVFSLASLLTSWNINIGLFLTQTLPPFMHAGPVVTSITGMVSVFGLALITRAAFTVESVFNISDWLTDKIYLHSEDEIQRVTLQDPALKNGAGDDARNNEAPELSKNFDSHEGVSEPNTFNLRDFWDDPINTTIKYFDYVVKGFSVLFNGGAFATLGIMGASVLQDIFGFLSDIAAKVFSWTSTSTVSCGATSLAIENACEVDPGKFDVIFQSPIAPQALRRKQDPSQQPLPSPNI